jgi:hypothetical protein
VIRKTRRLARSSNPSRAWRAAALAIISTKDPEHFTASSGGYFQGMRQGQVGELHLDHTVWTLRRGSPRR